ncbi:MoaD/ThiS family protein [Sediminibacter sp. Hel_I_10]|uniref:MoaD/ThiS family protein n=1 Tax=Sediminibacter sp. Hel_I_10 TaxID=1392490 RepID=UPI00047EE312|nr:MoaD/ThiS family protein [Sediminibacter sp. Hel_I_10]
MKITVTYFGKLTELTGMTSEELSIAEASVKGVKSALEQRYPSLKNSTYQIAENNSVLANEAHIQTRTLDIFPPFSGG